MSLDWLIVGGGIHGVHLAARLIGEAGVDPDALTIVDPGPRLLACWRTRTATTGMQFLRSPSVHHLDLGPWSLDHFAGGDRRNRAPGLFAPPLDRPSLALFDAHCERVIETFDLARRHLRARADACSLRRGEVRVRLSTGHELASRRLLLAIGTGDRPLRPPWAPEDEARVSHIFEPGFDGWPSSGETVAVVGGGISAAQVALRLVGEGHRVDLVSRHALRRHQYDWESAWLGPKRMTGFRDEACVVRRRELIDGGRHPGSVPPDVERALLAAIEGGAIRWHEDDVTALDVGDAHLELRLARGETSRVERVLLATGFASARPGGRLVDELQASASLPTAPCGYPVVDDALRWHPSIHVTGPLAELELGPVARNIAGARRAGDRLVAGLRAACSPPRRKAS
ncbi:MAG: FAD/NAD(P)-binding protein [Myxococcota bacterium]